MAGCLLAFALRQQRQPPALLRNARRVPFLRAAAASLFSLQTPLVITPTVSARHIGTGTVGILDKSIHIEDLKYPLRAAGLTKSDILTSSMKRTGIKSVYDVLDRLAEARALCGTKYLVEILDSMRMPAGDSHRSSLSEQPLRPELMSRKVCQSLLEIITETEEAEILPRIDTKLVLEIYDYAKSQEWEIDPLVLANTAAFLANSSFNGYMDAVSIVYGDFYRRMADMRLSKDSGKMKVDRKLRIMKMARFSISKIESNQISLKELQSEIARLPAGLERQANAALSADPLDTAMVITRGLVNRSFGLTDDFFSVLMRALCVREHVSEAKWAFSVFKRRGNLGRAGNIYASMMSMYYRVSKWGASEKLFLEFKSKWQAEWGQIKSTRVMFDPVSASAEKWRLEHEENVVNPKVITTDELRKIRSAAADPFYQRAMTMIRSKNVQDAVAFVKDAKHKEFVAFTPNHFDIMDRLLIENEELDLALELFQEILRGANTEGGRDVLANQVIYSEAPRFWSINRILWALPKAGRWADTWKLVDSDGIALTTRAVFHGNASSALMLIALTKGNLIQAKACADRMRKQAVYYPEVYRSIPDSWFAEVVIATQKICGQPTPNGQHPVSEVVEALVLPDSDRKGFNIVEWNARLVKFILESSVVDNAIRAQVLDELFGMVCRRNLLSTSQVRGVVVTAVNNMLELVPENSRRVPVRIGDAPSGWNSFLTADMPPDELMQLRLSRFAAAHPSTSFWQCALEAIAKGTGQAAIHDNARKCLLMLKLAFVAQAKAPPPILAMVNQLLLEAHLPIVDTSTGDLLPEIEQVRRASAYQQLPRKDRTAAMAKLIGQPPTTQWRVTVDSALAATSLTNATPIEKKARWYLECRRNLEVPTMSPLKWYLTDLVDHNKRNEWEPILRDHIPEYLKAMNDPSIASATERIAYATSVWSLAVEAYSDLGEIEEAAKYHHMILDMGSFPLSHSNAQLLLALQNSNAPLPVFRAHWSASAPSIYGLKPALPPSGQSPADLFLISVDREERAEQLAQIALYMLYGSFHSETFVTDRLFISVLCILRDMRMMDHIRHIFECVIPAAVQSLPLKVCKQPFFTPSSMTWGTVIIAAMACGERDLAEYWFKEYRSTALPVFRKQVSPASASTFQKISPYTKSFLLSYPYYVMPTIWIPRYKRKGNAAPMYNHEQVKLAIELDRMRELDGLRLPFKGVSGMLTIYSRVPEYRDMAKAESLATEVVLLSQNQVLPKVVRHVTTFNMAKCWFNMVKGYLDELQHLQSLPNPDTAKIKYSSERLVRWYFAWKNEYLLCVEENSKSGRHATINLTREEVKSIKDIAQCMGKKL